MAAPFAVGSLFDSYEKFEEEFNIYKSLTFAEFFIKDCRTLQAAKKRYPQRVESANEDLKYYFVKFMCVHGGNYKKRKTTGERNASSMRKGCSAYVYLKLSSDGKNLVITDMCDTHNHELCPELFQFFPRQRRLAPDMQQEVLELLDLKANKKLVQEKYTAATNKKITLRDLSNLQAKGNTKQSSLEDTVHKLQSDYDCTVKVMVDESKNLRAVYVQDAKMKREFAAFPEIVFADCTYKLTDLRTPIFVLMTEDGNGQSCVVAAGVFVSEEKEVYKWFMECFKILNPAVANTQVMMTDKDITERSVFKEVLPSIRLRICLFHVMKIFRREISEQEMGLSPKEVLLIRSVLQKMCYVSSLEEFEELYQELKDVSPDRVITYFDRNWKENIEEWTSISHFQADCLLNRTNNRIESFNAKLKSVISHFSSLDNFFKHFFAVIKCLRLEREASAAKVLSTFTTETFSSDEEKMYYWFVTPYAFKLLEKQFEYISTVTAESLVKYSTTENYCECSFKLSVHLPCKHILKYRLDSNITAYDTALVNNRWSRKYFSQHKNSEPTRQVTQGCTVDIKPRKVVTTQQKFRKAVVVTNKLATLVSESSNSDARLKLLEKIYKKWASGKEVQLIADEEDSADNVAEGEDQLADEENFTQSAAEGEDQLADEENFIQSAAEGEDQLADEENFSAAEGVNLLDPIVGSEVEMVTDFISLEVIVESEQEDPPTATNPSEDTFSLPEYSAHVMDDHDYVASVSTNTRPEHNIIDATPTPHSSSVHQSNLKDICLPSKVKVRGRPKGCTVTAIGLPRAKKGKKKAFVNKNHHEKMNVVLSWFVTEDVLMKVRKGYLIDESDIECRPEKIHCGAVDEHVDVFIVRPFFTTEGWTMLLNVLENKKKSNVWICSKCNHDAAENSICCDSCLSWYHFKCVGIKSAPKKEWFCMLCK